VFIYCSHFINIDCFNLFSENGEVAKESADSGAVVDSSKKSCLYLFLLMKLND